MLTLSAPEGSIGAITALDHTCAFPIAQEVMTIKMMAFRIPLFIILKINSGQITHLHINRESVLRKQ